MTQFMLQCEHPEFYSITCGFWVLHRPYMSPQSTFFMSQGYGGYFQIRHIMDSSWSLILHLITKPMLLGQKICLWCSCSLHSNPHHCIGLVQGILCLHVRYGQQVEGWNLRTSPWYNEKYRTLHCIILLWRYVACVWSQTTILALHREYLAWKWDMVPFVKFKTLDRVLSFIDVVQYKKVGYYTIMFVYGAHETSLCPLNTTKGSVKGIFVM